MSDRIVIMNHGRIVQLGSPSELYERPRTAFAASFLGKSNFLRRGEQVLALRPEKIDIAPAGAGMCPNTLSGQVRSVTYMGSLIRLAVACGTGADIEVHADTWRMPHRFAEGQAVDLGWRDEAAVPVEDDSEIKAGTRLAQ